MATLAKKPVDWERKPIIKLFEVKTGTTPSTKNPEYWNDGTVLWYTPADLSKVNDRVYVGVSKRKVTERALQDRNLNVVPKNSIILATRAPVGTLGLTTTESTFNQGCKGLVPRDSTQTEPLFYYYYLTMERRALENQSSGSTFKELPKPRLEAFLVPAPAYKEQHKIASILYTLDRAIQKSKVATQKTELLKQGMMRELLKKGIGHTDFHVNSKLGRVPSAWKTGTFSDIADINPKTDTSHLSDDSYVTFLPMPNVGEDGHILRNETKKYSEVRNGYTTFIENDVLFAKITPCMENGKGALATNLVNGIGFGSTEFHVLRAKSHSDPNFIFQLSRYRSFRRAAERFMTGSAGQQRVSARVFEQYPIPIIPPNEQKCIATILSAIDHKLDLQRQRITALDRLKQGLMNDLLTGKRRVVA